MHISTDGQRRYDVIVFVIFLLIFAASPETWPQEPSFISGEPEEPPAKLESSLQQLLSNYRERPEVLGARIAHTTAEELSRGLVRVEVLAASVDSVPMVSEAISRLGGEVELTFQTLIQALVSITALGVLAERDEVLAIRAPRLSAPAQGSIVSQGVEFASGDEAQDLTIDFRGEANLFLQLIWEGDCGERQASDFDLYLYDSRGREVAKSESRQDAGFPEPNESIFISFRGSQQYQIKVKAVRARHPVRMKLLAIVMGPGFSGGAPLEYGEAAGSVVEPGISPNVIAIGAVHWATLSLQSYSSQGPTTDGRIKPDFAAPTNVSTASARPDTFGGTSAASPHVGGTVALIKGAFPDYTPEQIEDFLERRAEDLGSAGKDNKFGAGLAQLGPPPEVPGLPEMPLGLTATAVAPDQIELQWEDRAVNEDGFLIERRLESETQFGELSRLGPDSTRFLDATVEPNMTYCYRVSAFNARGNSDPLSFEWRFVSRPQGSQARLDGPTSADPTFTPDVAGDYVLEVTVRDPFGAQDGTQMRVRAVPSYEYTAELRVGELGRIELPSEIREQLPAVALSFQERPHTARRGRTSNSLEEVGLTLNPSTGTLFGVPKEAGRFLFLLDVFLDGDGRWIAELWASVTIAPVGPVTGELITLRFTKLEFLRPQDWQRTQRDGCLVYRNISAEPSPIRVTLPEGSVREYEIPPGNEVIVCGDVVYIDTRQRGD